MSHPSPTVSLTVAQRKRFDHLDARGRIVYCGPKGYGRSSWLAAMERVAGMGLIAPAPDKFTAAFVLTARGEEYRRGARAAEAAWRGYPALREKTWARAAVREAVSAEIGPNVPHPEEVAAGARERWLDLRARRIYLREGAGGPVDVR